MQRAPVAQAAASAAVLVPCCNEAGTINDCVERLLQVEDVDTVVLIDDGSRDGSTEICADLCRRHGSSVKALLLAQNVGKNAAIREGLRAVETEFVIVFDADMTVAPAAIQPVIQALREHPGTFAYGSRFDGGARRTPMSLTHRLGNRFFARWISLLLKRQVGDVLCGLKGIPREVLLHTPQSACRWGDFDFFFGAADAGLRFVEVPVAYAERRAGRSKMRAFSSGLYFAWLCARQTVRRLFRRTTQWRS